MKSSPEMVQADMLNPPCCPSVRAGSRTKGGRWGMGDETRHGDEIFGVDWQQHLPPKWVHEALRFVTTPDGQKLRSGRVTYLTLPDFLYADQPVIKNQAIVDELGELQPQSHARDSSANHPSLRSPTQHRPLLLLIEDTRGPINETSATGEWKASSWEIVDALQSSISALEGPARIGVADPDNPGYTIFLATGYPRKRKTDLDRYQHRKKLNLIRKNWRKYYVVSELPTAGEFGISAAQSGCKLLGTPGIGLGHPFEAAFGEL
ncbi:hypothetical protein B0H11DRAFT_1914260 [Mycena galericulata]|nr:hypothetical protein B0H11DRAFT_1914260 [Mycena galericulata]